MLENTLFIITLHCKVFNTNNIYKNKDFKNDVLPSNVMYVKLM